MSARKVSLSRRVTRAFRRGLRVIRHPIGVTCDDCGFLDLRGREVTAADRIMYRMRGSAGMPHAPEDLLCARSLWISYDLTYVAPTLEGIFDEIEERRRGCVGFHRYVPGLTAKEHFDLVTKAADRRHNVTMAVLGAILGGLITFLVTRLTK